jgi:hypothetical protein
MLKNTAFVQEPYFLTNQDNIKSKSNKSAVVDKPKLRLYKSKEGGKETTY